MPVSPGRRGAIAFFVTVCVSLVVLAIALNIGWIVLNWREAVPLLLGVLVFAAIIAGLILNTTFLIREIRRNEQHDAFVNSVTHELKTPVTSLRLHLETLKVRGHALDEAKRQEFYDTMLEDSERLLTTIEHVLQTGRAGRAPLHKSRVDLRGLVDECVTSTLTRRHLSSDTIRVMPPRTGETTIEVMGDREELRGAIMNLIDNAVKYSDTNSGLDISARRSDGQVVLTLRDYGRGIPETELPHIFEKFYRGKQSSGKISGAGLGLAIVRAVIDAHGGKIWAESRQGEGSTFHIALPVANEVNS